MIWFILGLVAIAIPTFKKKKSNIKDKIYTVCQISGAAAMLLHTDGTHEFVVPWKGKKFKLQQIWSLLNMEGLPMLEYLVGTDSLFLVSVREGKERGMLINEQASLMREESSQEEAKLVQTGLELILGTELECHTVKGPPKVYGPALLVHGDYIGEE